MLYIRADSNSHIGTGHVMRCLAIAESFLEINVKVTFITCEESTRDIVRAKCYPFIMIHGKYDEMDNEIEQIKNLCSLHHIRKLLIDSYFLTENYTEQIGKITKVIYLGSLKTIFPQITAVINYSMTLQHEFYQQYGKTKCWLGATYTPLRREFTKSVVIEQSNERYRNIVISSGGTDEPNFIGSLLDTMVKQPDFDKQEVSVILGVLNMNDMSKYKHYQNLSFYKNISNIAELFRKSDLAISAAGTTLYELCALGIPTISYGLVEEQVMEGKAFEKVGVIPFAGAIWENDTILHIEDWVAEALSNEEGLKSIKTKMQQLIDGKGTNRIRDEIMKLGD